MIVSRPPIDFGWTSRVSEAHIDHDHVMAYALATNDPNPAYLERGAVPPFFTAAFILDPFLEALEVVPLGAFDGDEGRFHGEHDVYFHHPVRAGSIVRSQANVHCATQTPIGVLLVIRIVITDDDGPAVEHFWSAIHIGGMIDEPLGPPLADHTLPERSRLRSLGSHVFTVTGDQPFRYAGVSYDHAPMHSDDEAARGFGLPSKCLQGMCTLAMCSGAVVKLASDGDPTPLRRLAARLSSPVYPRHELAVEVFDIGPTADGGHAYGFEATSAGVTVIRHGRAETFGSGTR
jgi:acyl dehydratase